MERRPGAVLNLSLYIFLFLLVGFISSSFSLFNLSSTFSLLISLASLSRLPQVEITYYLPPPELVSALPRTLLFDEAGSVTVVVKFLRQVQLSI